MGIWHKYAWIAYLAVFLAVLFLNQNLSAWQALAIVVICTSVAVEAQ